MIKTARIFKPFQQTANLQKYFFNLHEYQAHDIMTKYGINVQKGALAFDQEHAKDISATLSNKGGLIVKAQVHAGGRGKGVFTSGYKGGVKVLSTPEEVENAVRNMINYNLITKQTPKEGLPCKAVLIKEGININREIYLAFILDRKSQLPTLIASKHGGMDIEEVAEKHPESMVIHHLDPFSKDISEADLDKIIQKLELSEQSKEAKVQLKNFYTMFNDLDCTQLEINPWATDEFNKLWAVDAKVNIDENARFRQQAIYQNHLNSAASEDTDPHEEKALAAGLSYVALDGNIGCLVNGAGLAMATMDMIKLQGGEPANFLDCGGAASEKQITTAFQILTEHPKVKTILINIFGGILSCQMMAKGIVAAAKNVDLKVPLVVKFNGNEAKEANELFFNYMKTNPNIKIHICQGNDLNEGAKIASEITKNL